MRPGDGDPPLSVLAHGHPTKTSHVLRAASVQNGGLINAARGPFTAAFVRGHGAPGAISFALDLGAAMLAARGGARVAAAADFLGGLVLIEGEVDENTVRYGGGFDTGVVTLEERRATRGARCLQWFMTADEAGDAYARSRISSSASIRRAATRSRSLHSTPARAQWW